MKTSIIGQQLVELDLAESTNKTAAEMLGLSRQSLYVKLRRYGLGDLEPAGEAVDDDVDAGPVRR